ncbi:MAG: hypothetical protein ACE5PM_07610 [Candidatus Hydrothermarchaeales archaeon]
MKRAKAVLLKEDEITKEDILNLPTTRYNYSELLDGISDDALQKGLPLLKSGER